MDQIKYILLLLIVFISTDLFSQENRDPEREIKFALIEASRLKAMGNIEETIKLYKTCVNSYPDCAVAWYELGSIYAGNGLDVEAEKYLHNAYLLDKKNYWFVIAYTDLLSRNKKFKEAVKILNKSVKNFPDEEILLKYRTVENYYDLRKFNKSIKVIEELEKKFGYSQIITARKIEILKVIGNHKNIIKEFNDVIAKEPENITFNIMYAEYLVEKKLIKEAIERYEHVLNIDKENIYAISNLSELYAGIKEKEKAYKFLLKTFQSDEISVKKKIQTLSYMMSDEERVKNDKEFIKEIILYLNTKEADNYEFLIVVYDFYYKINELTEAFKVIKKVTELRNDNYIIWAQALYNGIQIERHQDVIELGNKALTIFPNKDDLRVFIAMAHFNKKEYHDSYAVLSETRNNFTEPDIKRQRNVLFAESAYKSGNFEESFKAFEYLIEEEPEDLILKNNYSYYLALEGINLERARDLSYETIVKEPENSTFLDTYSWILFKMELFEEAEIYVRKAIQYDISGNTEILEHMKQILLKNEKYEEAELIEMKLVELNKEQVNE